MFCFNQNTFSTYVFLIALLTPIFRHSVGSARSKLYIHIYLHPLPVIPILNGPWKWYFWWLKNWQSSVILRRPQEYTKVSRFYLTLLFICLNKGWWIWHSYMIMWLLFHPWFCQCYFGFMFKTGTYLIMQIGPRINECIKVDFFYYSKVDGFSARTKGQLISKCLFEKIIWTKIPTKNLIDSAQQV